MTGSPTLVLCVIGAAANAGVILAAGWWLSGASPPPRPATTAVQAPQRHQGNQGGETSRARAPWMAGVTTASAGVVPDCNEPLYSTPPDDRRPLPCPDPD